MIYDVAPFCYEDVNAAEAMMILVHGGFRDNDAEKRRSSRAVKPVKMLNLGENPSDKWYSDVTSVQAESISKKGCSHIRKQRFVSDRKPKRAAEDKYKRVRLKLSGVGAAVPRWKVLAAQANRIVVAAQAQELIDLEKRRRVQAIAACAHQRKLEIARGNVESESEDEDQIIMNKAAEIDVNEAIDLLLANEADVVV